jgi:pyruvate/2-oxoglutarate/acetoin dehydrogenase E1 component
MEKTYKDCLFLGMKRLIQNKKYMVIGQGATDGGHGMAATIPKELYSECIEMPVFEETQTGIALGMGLAGKNVVSIYPRFDFFISGLSQLINHSDKINLMSNGLFSPNIIFRVGVGAKVPLDAGPQHTNNYSIEMKSMLTNIKVHELQKGANPLNTFKEIEHNGGIHLIVEHYEFYGDIVCGN